MSSFSMWIIAAGVFTALVIAQVAVKAKKPIIKTISGIITGVVTLAIVNVASIFTGVTIPVSLLTVGTSAVLGIPGVTMLLFLQMIL